MIISYDSTVFWGTGMSYTEQYKAVKAAGFDYINPYNDDFPGYFKRPKYTMDEVDWHVKQIHNAGLKIGALTTGFGIQMADEFMRQYAVDCWKQMFDIGERAGVRVFNTELGVGADPLVAEAKLMRSLDELVPIMEKRGLRMDFQAHPGDFYEHYKDVYDIIRSYDSPALAYEYSIPHTFHYDDGKADIEANMLYCRKHLKHVLFADTKDYTKIFRYNVNPADKYWDGSVRYHDHIARIGEGDVDFDKIFEMLRRIGFNEADDTIATFNPLGYPETAIEDGIYTRELIEKNLVNVPSIKDPEPDGYDNCSRLGFESLKKTVPVTLIDVDLSKIQ